jgi:glycosyltransferase involved in cell wall biosynthesis
MAKVSILMNCYNGEKYLKETVDSVMAQTYEDWELIFWDNQSTDKTAEIIHGYNDERIKYFYAPEFTSLGEARNLGIEKCSSEWIACLDSDDLWDKEKLERSFLALEKYEEKENVSLIYSLSNMIDEESNVFSKTEKAPSGDIHEQLLIEGNFIVFSSIIIRKDISAYYGNIDASLQFCTDYDLLLKITKKYKAVGVEACLTGYRIHGNNITSTKIYVNTVETLELLENYLLENNVSWKIKFNIWMNNAYRVSNAITKLFLNKEFINIWRLFKRNFFSLFLSPFAIVYKKIGY